MRVTLITADDDTFHLAGGEGVSERVHSSTDGFVIAGQIQKQIIRPVRATHARPIDRGQLLTTVEFGTWRQFATEAEAALFAAEYPQGFPREGEVEFVAGSKTRRMEDAVVSPPRCVPLGTSVRMDYTAQGGLIPAPTPEFLIPQNIEGAHYHRRVMETDAEWFEVGFVGKGNDLLGDAVIGWTDAAGNLLLRFERSADLVTWDHAIINTVEPESNDYAEDAYIYWARGAVPRKWNNVMVDLTLNTARYGKSITSLKISGVEIDLDYPYAMPADAAALQADLRTAGYDDATVTTSSAAISVVIKNHLPIGTPVAVVTMSGADVTDVKFSGSTVSIDYPYTMPADAADLQADLRTAGVTYAVVTLHGDPWEVFVPDVVTGDAARTLQVEFTPADPFNRWQFNGEPNADNPGNYADGSFSNLRTPEGGVLVEASERQFFRLRVLPGPNYQY